MEFHQRRGTVSRLPDGIAADAAAGSRARGHSASGDLIVPVVLSGGGGSRLWPLSTKEKPKQFLTLFGSSSLFRHALDRVGDAQRFAAPIIVGSTRHAALCEAELGDDLADASLVLEPVARNTAPAIVMAAAVATELHGPGTLMLVMPSDQVIEDVDAFHEAVATGVAAARDGSLVTFGVRPTGPDTGYGYLEIGDELPAAPGVSKVERFVEKPPLDAAEAMVAGGRHLWNAGIFLFRADIFLEEAQRLAPNIASPALAAISSATRDGIRIVPDERALEECESESVDYAIMEHSPRVAVVPMSPGWSDLGSWDALADLIGDDGAAPFVTALDCDGCFIRSDGIPIAALGVSDLIIVASERGVLVLPKGRSQEVRMLLSMMDSMKA